MLKPIINILIRTSKRPKYFAECMKSIINQTSSNWKVIVYTDDKESHETYLKNIKHIYSEEAYLKKLNKSDLTKNLTLAPFDLYLNEMIDIVSGDEWVMILDDDDKFLSNDAIKVISENIVDDNSMLLWKVKFPHGTIPSQENFKNRIILERNISMIGFCISKKILDEFEEIRFHGKYTGDYYVISSLAKLNITNKIWIDEILTGLQRSSGWGGRGTQDDK